jgi:hypothetical protein
MPSDKNLLRGMVHSLVTDTIKEVVSGLSAFDVQPKLDDKKIKDAILNLTPEGLNKLFTQYGIKDVTSFLNEFRQGKRW